MTALSVAAKNAILRMIGVMTVAGAGMVTVGVINESFVRAQSPKPAAPAVRLPDESAGIDGIARTLIAAFDQVDIVALGEAHERTLDSNLRIAVVRHPEFAKKVRSIVVEFGSTTEQSTLDRYIRGENISPVQLADARIRVFGGDPGPGDSRSRDTAAVSVLKEQVLEKRGKALVIYGAAHFYKDDPSSIRAGGGIVTWPIPVERSP